MSKNKKKEMIQSGNNTQEKLTHALNSVQADKQIQPHNVKKEGMGPNTKR